MPSKPSSPTSAPLSRIPERGRFDTTGNSLSGTSLAGTLEAMLNQRMGVALLAIAVSAGLALAASDPDFSREVAEKRLRALAPPDEEKVLELVGALSAEDFATRQNARRELVEIAPLMGSYLEDLRDATDDPELRQGIARVLSSRAKQKVELGRLATWVFEYGYRGLAGELVAALASASTATDSELAIVAARFSAEEAERDELVQLLGNVIPAVRAGAARVLQGLGGDVRAELRPLLEDAEPFVRFAAAEAFVTESDPACLPVLAGLATVDDFYLRWRASEMLRSITAGEIDIDPVRPPKQLELGRWFDARGWAVPGAPSPLELLPAGDDLSSWEYSPQNRFDQPGIETGDGFLRLAGGSKGVWAYPMRFQNYRLRLEWRFVEGQWQRSDSGISLGKFAGPTPRHAVGWEKDGALEVQIRPGHTGVFYPHDTQMAIDREPFDEFRAPKLAPDNETIGGWNRLEIVERDGTIQVFVNGLLQNEATRCSTKLTSLALRCEGYPIDFRNMNLEPLPGARIGGAPEDGN